MPDGCDIFISHSSKQREIALSTRTLLEGKNFTVHLSTSDTDSVIKSTENWKDALKQSIESAKLVVLILSEESNESVHVNWEMGIALELKKPISIACFDEFGMSEDDVLSKALEPLRSLEMKSVITVWEAAKTGSAVHEIVKTGIERVEADFEKARERPIVQDDTPETLIERIAHNTRSLAAKPSTLDSDPQPWRILADVARLLEVLCPGKTLEGFPDVGYLIGLGQKAKESQSADKPALNNLKQLGDLLRYPFNRAEDSDTIIGAWQTLGYAPATGPPPRFEPSVIVDMGDDTFEPKQLARFLRNPLVKHLSRGVESRLVLMPLLGTGVLQIRTDETADPVSDEDTITWDKSVAGRKNQESEESARRSFLEQILESRRDGRSVIRAEPVDEDITALRAALFDLAFISTEIFVRGFSASPTAISDWESHDVLISGDDLSVLLGAGITAVEALRRLVIAAQNGDYTLLGAVDLEEKLQVITEKLNAAVARKDYRLSGATVEWMTDVFWHSMVFDSPMYPRMDELALQISLVDASSGDVQFRSPLRRLEPAASVPRVKLATFEKSVRCSVERGFTADRQGVDHSTRRRFYAALANTLVRDFKDFSANADVDQAVRFPIAIVTTFDLELERALATSDLRGKYHVAIPVLSTIAGTPNRARLRWMIGTFTITGNRWFPELHDLQTPDGPGWQWLDDIKDEVTGKPMLDGPLVMKVNGSPLHSLELNANDFDRVEDPPQHHAVGLGEFDIFQASRVHFWAGSTRRSQGDGGAKQGLPAWLTKALESDERYWFLVGHRLTDWNTRMRLFLHLPDELGSDRAVAINRFFDRDRSRVLSWLNIKPLLGDAAGLSEWLNDYATRP